MQKSNWEVSLIEPQYQACLNARKRGIENVVCNTISEKSLKDGVLQQAMLLDVLEHVQDDVAFLKIFHSKLVEGGKLLITVPAFNSLWSSEDDSDGHFRRYKIKSLVSVVEQAGFKVLYINYFFEFLYLPIFFIRHLGEKFGLLKKVEERTQQERDKIAQEQFKEKGGFVDCVLRIFERCELKRLLKQKRIHFGSSIICILET